MRSLPTLLLLLAPPVAFALVAADRGSEYTSGATFTAGYAGSPVEDGRTCTNCHGGTALNGLAYVTPPATYTPGGPPVDILISEAVSGFQLTVLDSANNAFAGSLSGVEQSGVVTTEWSGAQYAAHDVAYSPSGWVIKWKPPASGVGPINIYAAARKAADGKVYVQTVTVEQENQVPVASFTATPASGVPPLEVSFDASGSTDPDGSLVDYTWDFGDEETGGGPTITHTYLNPGIFTVTLTVMDDQGASSSSAGPITVQSGVATEGDPAAIPDHLGVEAIYPNPFKTTLTATVLIHEPGAYILQVADMLGRVRVRQNLLVTSPGRIQVLLDLSTRPSGQYLVSVRDTRSGQTASAMAVKVR